MDRNEYLDSIDLSKPIYEEEETILIPFEQANATYQDLVQRHKSLGASLKFHKRRLALALAKRIRQSNQPAGDWELALLDDAGLSEQERS